MTLHRYKAVDCFCPDKEPVVVEAVDMLFAARTFAEDLWHASGGEDTWFVVGVEPIDGTDEGRHS